MDKLYIKTIRTGVLEYYSISLESLLAIHVYQISKNENLQLEIFFGNEIEEPKISLNFAGISYQTGNVIPLTATYCKWPIIISGKQIISGLCSVARHIIKSNPNTDFISLLGFKESCLMACSENSIWTMFCEVDMPYTIKNLLNKHLNISKCNTLEICKNILKFENHMMQPVKIHNIYKVARLKHNKNIASSVPISDLNLDHVYSEGPFMTLSDIILFVYFHIYFTVIKCKSVRIQLKLTYAWYKNMQSKNLYSLCLLLPKIEKEFDKIFKPDIPTNSLYKSDSNRYKPEKRVHTKQHTIEKSLQVVKTSDIRVVNLILPFGFEVEFDWSKVPLDINPKGGALPAKRADRKCEQLENLAKATIKIAKEGHKIVDFCSGSGHLGLLLAFLLPQCRIILVENKEQSLSRASERIKKLNLVNVTILQCNLDYLTASFDIGVSLHACGVATDLVIQNCIKNNAHFVSCACCYGGIKNCHLLTYPRSNLFQEKLLYEDYLSLAHAADQTHDIDNVKTQQGYDCMDIVDTDRKLHAENYGYEVFLGKLQPITCTNKNNLLVGIFK